MSPDRFGFHARRESQIHSGEFVEEHKGLSTVPASQRQVSPFESSLLFDTTTSITNNNTNTINQDGSRVLDTAGVERSSPAIDNSASGFAIFEGHDSLGFTSGGNPRLDTPRNQQEAQFWNSDFHNNNPQYPLQGPTMGLNNNHGNERLTRQQRTVSEVEEPKMEDIHQSTSSTAGNYLRTNERKDHEDDSTTAHSIDSSVPSPALSSREHPNMGPNPLGATTPSTVSTAASTTDEASLMLDPANLERLSLRFEGHEGTYRHRRAPSWESHTLPLPATPEPLHETGHFTPVSHAPTSNVWNNPQAHARIATFRNEAESSRYGFRPPEPTWAQQQHASVVPPPQPAMYRQPVANPYNPYQNPTGSGPRGHSTLPPTPPRGSGRGQRAPQSPHHRGAGPYSSNPPSTPGSGPGSRSSAEVLKTLLRKKACLYEPDTSRAVALVTWLVGRELALEFGFFSRQQLQAGVHACVAQKIDSGVITRTKVNRCMQIILNSCFHYIIPRPDGSEENGDFFRLMFAREVTDDALLLRELPAPWDDLTVSTDTVLNAALSEVKSPQSSPMLSSMGNPSHDPKEEDDQDPDNKRAVLLCFNENVRCAEDVFRCHNEFIRDTAHACHLQLSSYEWRHFFGAEAAGAPHLWGNIGIPIPSNEMCDPGQVDALGMLSMNELTKFRTFWCSKRYEHDHELCGFAHIEVNGGWLRRNPSHHNYRAEMCQFVARHADPRMGSKVLIINECPHGTNCEFSHSSEEVFYHPIRYKRRVCSSTLQRHSGICHHGDACPDFHAMDTYRFPSKKIDGRAGARHSRHTGGSKGTAPPSGAPILYVSPAPPSGFEEHLVLPGLKSLYRRHSSVTKAQLRQGNQGFSFYSNFGDDTGVAGDTSGATAIQPRGLPPAPPH